MARASAKTKGTFSVLGGIIGGVAGSVISPIMGSTAGAMAGFTLGGGVADLFLGSKQHKQGHAGDTATSLFSVTAATVVGIVGAMVPGAPILGAVVGTLLGSAFGVIAADTFFPRDTDKERKNTVQTGLFSAVFSTIGNVVGAGIGAAAGYAAATVLGVAGILGGAAAAPAMIVLGAVGFKLGGYVGAAEGIKRADDIKRPLDPIDNIKAALGKKKQPELAL